MAERLEREAQAPDVNVDGALLDVDVVAPDLVEQLRARVHALGPRQEEAQQPELGRTECDRGCPSAVTRCVAGSSFSAPTASGSCAASGARRRSTALIRAFSSRGENGLVT